MRLYACQNCGQVVYFENTTCMKCGSTLGYLPDRGEMSAVTPDGPVWTALANPGTPYRFCANWEASACNWMVLAGGESALCLACRHNRTIPDISDPAKHLLWQKTEQAKRRLFYTLVKLGLPLPTASSDDPEPLVFDFLADDPAAGTKVMTGHDEGLVTLSLAEADDAYRAKLRAELREPYRTLLGHFRHEVGHYYWDKLVRDGGELDSFRALFGDDRQSYEEALQRHYENGAPPGWAEHYITAYATMHPWEDWAESWAHYMHILDTLEIAGAFNMRIASPVEGAGHEEDITVRSDPHVAPDFLPLIEAWLPLTVVLNNLSRAMGQDDVYPFVIPPPAMQKLAYVHDIVQRHRRGELSLVYSPIDDAA